MGESIDNIINRKLEEMDLLPVSFHENNLQNYFRRIEEVIQDVENERKNNIKAYKINKISVLSICKKSNISRQTIYNYRDTLEKYILFSQEKQDKEDLFNKIEVLNERINALEEEIYLLHKRDLSLETQKIKIYDLNQLLVEKEEEIVNLNLMYNEILDDFNKLKRTLNNSQGNLIEFKSKDK
ncbi:MAG: hypothetical protein ACM3X7_01250 [Solirubrobacterales bacterium]